MHQEDADPRKKIYNQGEGRREDSERKNILGSLSVYHVFIL